MRKRSKGVKYSRVTKQQKYIFLSLVIQKGQSLHEAAFNAGIQYSTGKTILFFYKNKHTKYGNYQIEPTDELAQVSIFASYRAIAPQQTPPQIEIILGKKQFKQQPHPEPVRTTRITRRSNTIALIQQRAALLQQYNNFKHSSQESNINTMGNDHKNSKKMLFESNEEISQIGSQ